ncbi:TPA: hypothetical protein U2B44_001020 [Streptococcus suis]|nr:hypothetical protein [Streptococcus suis]
MSLKTYAFGIVTQALHIGKNFRDFFGLVREMAEQGADYSMLPQFICPIKIKLVLQTYTLLIV